MCVLYMYLLHKCPILFGIQDQYKPWHRYPERFPRAHQKSCIHTDQMTLEETII